MIRKHYYLSGRVQGVGLRYRAYHLANMLQLTGYARNLEDGRVELELQGEKEMVDRFLPELNAGTFISIDGIEERTMSLQEERSFHMH